MEDPYVYEPLEDNEIRLIKIMPGAESEPVSLEICHISLKDLPRYAAISYSWGTDAPDKIVMVEGKSIAIRPNLDALLHEFRQRPAWYVPNHPLDRSLAVMESVIDLFTQYSLSDSNPIVGKILAKISEYKNIQRRPEEGDSKWSESRQAEAKAEMSRIVKDVEELWTEYANDEGVPLLFQESHFLWIDAICINQADFDERAKQIGLMQNIYKEASCLLVWLGVEESESGKAIATLEKFVSEGVLTNQSFDINSGLLSRAEREEVWLAISKLLSRPWFSRAWILQEYTLGAYRRGRNPRRIADRMVFCCGKDRIDNLVEVAAHTLYYKYVQARDAKSVHADFWREKMLRSYGVQNLLVDFRRRRQFRQEDYPNRYQLLPMIVRTRLAESTDPRDRIYSLLGLANEMFQGTPVDIVPSALIVDYQVPVAEVYASFVRSVVQATRRLEILGVCTPHTRTPDGLIQRSWVPDWTNGQSIVGILVTEILNSDKDTPYTFTYDATPGVYCDAQFAADLSSMTVAGFVWGRIHLVSSPLETDDEVQGQLKSFRSECRTILESAHKYRTKENLNGVDLEETLLSALVTTWTYERDGKLQIDKWRDYFREWLKGDESKLEDPAALPEGGLPDKISKIQRSLESVAVPIFDKSNSELSKSLNELISSLSEINPLVDQATDPESETISKFKASIDSVLSMSTKLKELVAVHQLRKALVEEKSSAYEELAISATEEDLAGEGTPSPTDLDNSIPSAFASAFQNASRSSTRIFVTQNGYIGRAGNDVKEGDDLCVLLGCGLPFVLRPIDGHYEVGSESLVPEIMHGEAMVSLDEGKRKIQKFELH
jgi:hypothetical protein